MKQAFVTKRFSATSKAMIAHANTIIAEYQAEGFTLTLRQLYYQFVSRDLIENTVKSYKNLGALVNDARLAGLIDWDAIEDRTRNLSRLATWESPSEIVNACAAQFRTDWWADQENYVEVWIEKEALAGVFERVCNEWQVPFFCCRGYTSQSEMYGAARRLRATGKDCTILHFGDHDPSGIDMTRDIVDRLNLFLASVDVKRIALNMPQVEAYGPPPNPAKVTDARYASYESLYGDESWELDALEPRVLADLVREHVKPLVNDRAWKRAQRRQEAGRERLQNVAATLAAE